MDFYRDLLDSCRGSSGRDHLDVKKMTQDVLDGIFYPTSRKIMNEVRALPIHLQETLAFFTFFKGHGVIYDECRRPEGAPQPYMTCACKVCFDAYHQRWAEAKENHWDVMNRFNASLNYLYDPKAHSGTDMSNVKLCPRLVRIYGVKQHLIPVNERGKAKETAERILVVLVSYKDVVGQNITIENKVIMSGPRLTKPYPSSYIYISGNEYVDVARFCLPHGRGDLAVTAIRSMGSVVMWTLKYALLPLLLIELFARLFL